MSSSKRATVADDDDDLDDLDDVLDQFSNPPPSKPQPPPQPSSSAAPSLPVPDELDDDFVRELAAGMEDLMRDLVAEDSTGQHSSQSRADWDDALKALKEAAAAGASDAAPGAATPSTSAAADAAFQASLRAAMEKMKESEDGLRADEVDAASASELAQLQELLAGLGDGDAADDSGQLSGVLEGLMQSLMSKDILYEPLKDLSSKYPEYIETHRASLPSAELERYTAQSALVGRIVAIFETPDYADEDPVKSTEVLTLMNEMQTMGSPPAEIMGDMPPGMEMGPDGMPKLPDSCTIC